MSYHTQQQSRHSVSEVLYFAHGCSLLFMVLRLNPSCI
ncbi:hypothetical protein PPEP_a3381 [Pseudoalteromonas peptidolytica F12-50-A1]|uniref:Uncharacterized protein n=1 Tax=Pseudoalteromonas peptidolytica F12-50-A1 TaxID=1315280 RepID=A0A8I0MSK6_9GAMM|nr:hypothetical protein [Pseudoalteromonas peptidolytica F12-50-A1]